MSEQIGSDSPCHHWSSTEELLEFPNVRLEPVSVKSCSLCQLPSSNHGLLLHSTQYSACPSSHSADGIQTPQLGFNVLDLRLVERSIVTESNPTINSREPDLDPVNVAVARVEHVQQCKQRSISGTDGVTPVNVRKSRLKWD